MGGDLGHHGQAYSKAISIHSARVGGDGRDLIGQIIRVEFQSTPPVWAETYRHSSLDGNRIFQSTPPVWAETLRKAISYGKLIISIHSARVGGDA